MAEGFLHLRFFHVITGRCKSAKGFFFLGGAPFIYLDALFWSFKASSAGRKSDLRRFVICEV